MIVLGLVLMLAAAAGVIGVAASTGGTVSLEIFGMDAGDHSAAAVFAIGTLAGLVFALGIMLMRDGLVRHRARRREAVTTQRRRTEESETLRARNAELERELAER
jgi:hypothetical protein